MSLRAGDATVGVHIDTINEENMRNYFDLLEDVFNELNFIDHPIQKGSIKWTRPVCRWTLSSQKSLLRKDKEKYDTSVKCSWSDGFIIHNFRRKAARSFVDEG